MFTLLLFIDWQVVLFVIAVDLRWLFVFDCYVCCYLCCLLKFGLV